MSEAFPPCSAAAFERRYQQRADPWDFLTSPYERGRYAHTLAALSRSHYPAAYEPGCAEGALTVQLAPRCARLLATDISPTAVRRAQARCAGFRHVTVACTDMAAPLPHTTWDLIVVSEVGYYLSARRLVGLAGAWADRLRPGGELLAVHWLGHSPDHVLHGDDVHRILEEALPLARCASQRHPGFRLDSWIKA